MSRVRQIIECRRRHRHRHRRRRKTQKFSMFNVRHTRQMYTYSTSKHTYDNPYLMNANHIGEMACVGVCAPHVFIHSLACDVLASYEIAIEWHFRLCRSRLSILDTHTPHSTAQLSGW